MAILTLSGSPTFNGDSTCTIDSTGSDRVQAPATVLDETQGWLAMRVRTGWATGLAPAAFTRFFFWSDSGTDRIMLSYWDAALGFIFQRDGGGAGNTVQKALTFASGDDITVVAAWDATNVKLSANGSTFTTAGNTTIPVLAITQFDIGQESGAANWFNSAVHWFAAGTGRLVDSDASVLNAYGNTDPAFQTLPGNPVFLWKAVTSAYEVATPPGAATPRGIAESPPVLWNAPQRPEFPQASPPPAWNNASD